MFILYFSLLNWTACASKDRCLCWAWIHWTNTWYSHWRCMSITNLIQRIFDKFFHSKNKFDCNFNVCRHLHCCTKRWYYKFESLTPSVVTYGYVSIHPWCVYVCVKWGSSKEHTLFLIPMPQKISILWSYWGLFLMTPLTPTILCILQPSSRRAEFI